MGEDNPRRVAAIYRVGFGSLRLKARCAAGSAFAMNYACLFFGVLVVGGQFIRWLGSSCSITKKGFIPLSLICPSFQVRQD